MALETILPQQYSSRDSEGATMKTIRAAIALTVVLLVGGPWSPFSTIEAAASKGSKSSSSTKGASSSKTVHVRTYTRKDGTTVAAHARSAPHAGSTTTTPTHSTGASTSKTSPRVSATPTTAASSRRSTSHPSQSVTTGRTADGRIARSEEAKRQFMRQTGYPSGRPGYVVDHVRPLACGGADAPPNMHWQTVAEGKAKDKTERAGCR